MVWNNIYNRAQLTTSCDLVTELS